MQNFLRNSIKLTDFVYIAHTEKEIDITICIDVFCVDKTGFSQARLHICTYVCLCIHVTLCIVYTYDSMEFVCVNICRQECNQFTSQLVMVILK